MVVLGVLSSQPKKRVVVAEIASSPRSHENGYAEGLLKYNMAWVPDVMRNQELEKVLEVNTKIKIN